MATLFPSLISADLLNLKHEIMLLDPHVDGYHLDVMDFHFVPNLTWGPAFINAIRSTTQKPLFIHLMVEFPEKYFDRMHLAEGDTIAIHYESPSLYSVEELLRQISSHACIPSIALNPSTSLDPIYHLKDMLKNVLIMSVEPGFSGQPFKVETLEKLKDLSSWRRHHGLSFTISMDGGINERNCSQLIELGADQLAIASAIFSQPDHIEAIKNIVKNY